MNSRKILIILAVLVLLVLIYKMSERYVYSNTVPMEIQTFLDSKEMNFTETQKGFLVDAFNIKSVPPDPTNILGTFTDAQRRAIEANFMKYGPPKSQPSQPVKKFVPPTVTGFSCSKSSGDDRKYNCSFS